MDAKDILHHQSVMQSQRSNWDNLAQDTADYFVPEYADIITKRSSGLPLNDKIFESKAGEALQVWIAINNFMLTPRNRQWHKLTPKNDDLIDDPIVGAVLEQKTKLMFKKRYNAKANFAANVDKFFLSDGLFGNAILYVDSDDMVNIRYRHIHPKEIYFKESHQGVIDHVHRLFVLTARQALDKFGDNLPPKIKSEANNPKSCDTPHEFIHAVFINPDYNPNSLSPDKKRFKSFYICKTDTYKVSEGGYNVMPYIISRHMVALNEIYGRSPAMRVLPAVKASNYMKKTIMRTGALIADPPLISMNLVDVPAYSAMAGALNYGYLSDNGTPAIQPMQVGGRIDYGMELVEDLRKDIGTAFFMHIYQILVENPQMTATEVMQRTQEKAVLLAPVIGAKQNDFLGALIEREIDLLNEMGLFDDMPPELQSSEDIGIEYDTEMTRMMRADEGVGIMRTLETALNVAQADPNVIKVFNLPETIRELSLINGMPVKLLRSKEEIDDMNEQEQQMAQMQQAAQMASSAAPALKTANEAGIL
jgi:hypothetical protein